MQPADLKSVGIIGAGRVGQAMAQTSRRAGRQVVIANSRGPESLTPVVQALGDGVSAGTVKEAAVAGILVLAVMWPDVPRALDGLEWEGRILIDPTNDFDPSVGWAHVQRGRRRPRRPCSCREDREHLHGRIARIRSTPSGRSTSHVLVR
jgi:predicted dinucleotide-binding enzyme